MLNNRMRRIINGKLYDTETAEECGEMSYSNSRDFHYIHEVLYRKRNGEFFIAGEGGPLTRYSAQIDTNSWSGGSKIIPLTPDEAKQWAEEHLSASKYIELFGEPEE